MVARKIIDVVGLSKTYPQSPKAVFEGLSFTVDAGDVLWVTGESGAGKSTLLNILGLLSEASAGSYVLGGVEMVATRSAVRRAARLNQVSTIFQRGNLFSHLSVLDNVMVGMPKKDVSEARHHLASVGMEQHATRLAGVLSGGEQERVAIARASARRTPVLLADEPTAALDDGNAKRVLTLIGQEADKGVAVVIVSHDVRTAGVATKQLRLEGDGS